MDNHRHPSKEGKGEKRFSLNKKISIAMTGVVLLTLFAVCAIVFSAMEHLTSSLLDSGKKIGETAAKDSYSSMYEMTSTRLMELAKGRADLADDIFLNFEKSVIILAKEAELLYDSEDSYGEAAIPLPDAEVACAGNHRPAGVPLDGGIFQHGRGGQVGCAGRHAGSG